MLVLILHYKENHETSHNFVNISLSATVFLPFLSKRLAPANYFLRKSPMLSAFNIRTASLPKPSLIT